MQHITGTHFSAIFHGTVEIERGLGGLHIANEGAILFVEDGVLDSLGNDGQSRPVMQRESLQASIDSRIAQAERDMETILQSWGGDRAMLKALVSQVSANLAGAVSMIEQRGR